MTLHPRGGYPAEQDARSKVQAAGAPTVKTATTSRIVAGTVLASLLALSACGSESTASADAAAKPSAITVDHAQGSTEVPVNPETVYTFDQIGRAHV